MLVYALHQRRHSPAVVVSVAVVCAAIATGVSPEHGIAFMIGTTLFFVLCVKTRPVGFWPSIAGMGLCFLAIVAIAERVGIYTTLHTFSSGGDNLPILPLPGVICVLALFLVAACVAYRAFQLKQTESLSIYLLCICLFGLPSCFGRADPGHMQIGAFSALIIAVLALSRYPRVLLFAAIPFLYWDATPQLCNEFTPICRQVMYRIFDPSQRSGLPFRYSVRILHRLHCDPERKILEAKAARYFNNQRPIPELPDGTIINAPWGMTRNVFDDQSGKVDYGYFFGLQCMFLPSQVDSIIHWLQAHPERKLLIPKAEHLWPFSPLRCYAYDEGDSPEFSYLYGLHWASPKRQMQVVFPLCDYVKAHYEPDQVPFSNTMDLWHPIAAARPAGAVSTQDATPLSSLK
jgi:hypothetical protein